MVTDEQQIARAVLRVGARSIANQLGVNEHPSVVLAAELAEGLREAAGEEIPEGVWLAIAGMVATSLSIPVEDPRFTILTTLAVLNAVDKELFPDATE